VRYWVLAQTPVDSPADRPRDVRGWVHYREESGAVWGCRFVFELDTFVTREEFGWLEFFMPNAPRLSRSQHLELFAGRQLMLVCDVLDLDASVSPPV
jgi:hypothetical protein